MAQYLGHKKWNGERSAKSLWKSHGKMATRFTFSALFAEAWKASMTMPNIIAGFRAIVISPLIETKWNHLQASLIIPWWRRVVLPLLSSVPEQNPNLPDIIFLKKRSFFPKDCSIENDKWYHFWMKVPTHVLKLMEMVHPHFKTHSYIHPSRKATRGPLLLC